MSATAHSTGLQAPNGKASPPRTVVGEAKIEAKPEGKIELESEAFSSPVTTYLASSLLQGRAAPAAAGLRCRPAEIAGSANPATGSQPGTLGVPRPARPSLEQRPRYVPARPAARRCACGRDARSASRMPRSSRGVGGPSSGGPARGSLARAGRGHVDIPGDEACYETPNPRCGRGGMSMIRKRCRACARALAGGDSDRTADGLCWSGCWCVPFRPSGDRALRPCSPTATAQAPPRPGSLGGVRHRSGVSARAGSPARRGRRAGTRVCGSVPPRSTLRGEPRQRCDSRVRRGAPRTVSTTQGHRGPAPTRPTADAKRARIATARQSREIGDRGIPAAMPGGCRSRWAHAITSGLSSLPRPFPAVE